MIEETLKNAEDRMVKSVAALERDLAGLRTGRPNPGLIEHLPVDYYGAPTPLNQLGTISVLEGRALSVQVWDKSAASAVEKAILKSSLGLVPIVEGQTLRVPIPPLTEERRRDMVKQVRKRLEEGRVSVRNVRRDAMDELKKAERDKEISQDEQRRAQERLQKTTDAHIADADKIGEQKEQELMEV